MFQELLTIRLQRTGKKKQAYFRVVLQENSQKPGGKYLERFGNLDPHLNKFTVKEDRIKYWISKGAQVSDSVWNRLVDQKIVEGEKRQIVRGKKDVEAKLAVVENAPQSGTVNTV